MKENLVKQLIVAAERGHIEEVKQALAEGVDPSIIGENSGALHVAAFNGHKEIVTILLDAGANPNVADKQSYYPLQLAASTNQAGICKILLKAGAEIERTTDAGGTALHVAAASGFHKIINILLEAGANIEAKDSYGNTPLLTASAFGGVAVVKVLLKAGADIKATNDAKNTALLKALDRLSESKIDGWISQGTNRGRNVKYTVEKGAFRYFNGIESSDDPKKMGKIMSLADQRYCAKQSWGPSQHLLYLDALDTIKFLVKQGADVNVVNMGEQSAMWKACEVGEARIIKLLYKSEANFEAIENNGNYVGATCLHKVAASGRLDGLEMFFKLCKNYDINARDSHGWTPLHYIADLGGELRMVDLLLQNGADKTLVSTKDRGEGTPVGCTASEVAFHWKDTEVGEYLAVD